MTSPAHKALGVSHPVWSRKQVSDHQVRVFISLGTHGEGGERSSDLLGLSARSIYEGENE